MFDVFFTISGKDRLRHFFVLLLAACIALAANADPADTNAPPEPAPQPLPAPTPLQAAPPPITETRNTRLITIEECVKLALEHNLDIQIQQYNPLINQYDLNVGYSVYEPVFNFTGTKSYNDRPSFSGTNAQSGLSYSSTASISEADTYKPEIKGVLPTGMSYDLTGTWSRNSTLTGSPAYYAPPIWDASDPGPGISLKQPLLKNLWIDSSRLAIQLDKVALKTSEAALRLQIMTSVTAVKSAYFTLLYDRGNVEANATAYKLAEQLVAENVERVNAGTLAPLGEKQSESQAAASLAAMHLAEQQLLTQENVLKGLITDHFAEWAEVSPLPAEKLSAVPQDLDLQESWRQAVAKRPDLIEAKLKVEAQNVTLKYDLNQVFPELDVIGSYGRNSIENSFGSTLTDIRNGNQSYYSYGASVSVPLGGSYGARNQRKADKATLQQLLLTLKQVEQNIIIAVDNDVGNVRSTLQQVYATRDARVYAEQALDAEKKKLENGKSTSFIVLQLISNLTTARVNEVQALANYNIAIAQLALDQGTTLEANHIDLKVK